MPRQKSLLRLVVEPLAIALVLAFAVRSMVRIYEIPSASMQPTLRPGDHIAVTPYRFGSAPSRGDVVVFRSPMHADEFVVKRIIGTPGDLIASDGTHVTVGGHPLDEPYARTAAGMIAPQIVPSGCYFVMGDNREVSLDSRSWGVLPAPYILGRARMILWSNQPRPGSLVAGALTNAGAREAAGHPHFFAAIR